MVGIGMDDQDKERVEELNKDAVDRDLGLHEKCLDAINEIHTKGDWPEAIERAYVRLWGMDDVRFAIELFDCPQCCEEAGEPCDYGPGFHWRRVNMFLVSDTYKILLKMAEQANKDISILSEDV
jgi:hypothetical protein